jgi:parallel beta-helix repeat protein
LISNCIFQGNGASGLTLVRNTRGEIRSNLMQQNGFGIAVSDWAAGLIVSNQIFDNRCGIVISGTASPILRGNILSRNQEDGLVIAGKASPDFGKPYDPASNRLGDNQRFDLRNATSLQLVSSGNQLNLARVSGAVQLVSTGSPTTAWLKQSVKQSVELPGAVKPADRAQSWLVMVQRLLDRGIISPIDGSLQPEVTLAASEFAEWVHKASLVKVNANVSPLTRLEAIRILVEAASLGGGQPSLLRHYRDRAQIPTAQALTVATAVRYRLIVAATPDCLNPLQLVSRAEAAAMLYQTLVAKGQVEPIVAGSLPGENVNPLPLASPTRPPVVVLDPGHGGSDSGMATKVKTAEELMQEAGPMPAMLDALQMPVVPMSPLPMGQFSSELPNLAGTGMPGMATMPYSMSAGMSMSEMPPPGMPAEFLSMSNQLDQPEMPSLEEKTIVLSIAQAVASFLQQQGVRVILTRADDRDLTLVERLAIAQQHQADAFVSIHANASLVNQAQINGVETYHNPRSVEGARLAWAIHKALSRTADISDRGVHPATFPTLRQAAIPAAHVEVGYITGSQDAPSLANLAYHRYLARPIANAILRYLGQRG